MARSLLRKLRLAMERKFMEGSVLLVWRGNGFPDVAADVAFLDCHLDAVLVSLLHTIHGLIRLLDEPLGGEGVVGIGRDAERGRDARLESLVLEERMALDRLAD